MWAVYPADLEESTPEGVVRTFFRVLDRREQDTGDRGGIVLMHDTKPQSVEALPRIVDGLERRNCALLERGEELYDIVDDLGYFIPGHELGESLEERQLALREATARMPTWTDASGRVHPIVADSLSAGGDILHPFYLDTGPMFLVWSG